MWRYLMLKKADIIWHLFNFPGKILNDDTALNEYKIDEKNFVVVMVTKVSYFFILLFVDTALLLTLLFFWTYSGLVKNLDTDCFVDY